MALFDDKRGEMTSISKKVTAVLQQLAVNQISHGDLKANNILLVAAKPYLLDLDAMSEYKGKKAFKRHFNNDIERFMRNWRDNPVASELFSCLITSE